METEISGRVRNVELVKIIDWIPKVWHHLNRFLETHSSSDVTIGRQGWGEPAGLTVGMLISMTLLIPDQTIVEVQVKKHGPIHAHRKIGSP